MDDHVRMLERYKWDEAEFNAGFKGGIGSRSESKSFNEYEDVLQRELVKGKVMMSETSRVPSCCRTCRDHTRGMSKSRRSRIRLTNMR